VSTFIVGNGKLVNRPMLLNDVHIFSTHVYYYCQACWCLLYASTSV